MNCDSVDEPHLGTRFVPLLLRPCAHVSREDSCCSLLAVMCYLEEQCSNMITYCSRSSPATQELNRFSVLEDNL